MKFKNGKVILENEDAWTAMTELRKAILDCEIPLIKVIGFKLMSSEKVAIANATDRHNAVQENMIELSSNLSKLIFLPEYLPREDKYLGTSAFINIERTQGTTVTSGCAQFTSAGKSVKVLDPNIYLYHTVESLSVRLFVDEDTGQRSMLQCVERMKELYRGDDNVVSFFPMNTAFALEDYVLVSPLIKNGEIKYTLRNGMTDEMLNLLWDNHKRGGCQ